MKFTLASQRNPIFSSYSDADMQRMYSSKDNERKSLIIDLDCCISLVDINNVENKIYINDKELFQIDDELCARGIE